jgi:DNA topoisomerase I
MNSKAVPATLPALKQAAGDAGLRYVSDKQPGIVRIRRGKAFAYRMPNGKPVRAPEAVHRIGRLAIPPAWTDVWICPWENGHIQATGRDARGRKQYRYHEQWREVRDGTKYERMLAFGRILPTIRRRVAADLRRSGMPREKVLATVVRLLEATLIRVGNDEYATANGSFGLTTLHNRHAKVSGHTITFGFSGKSGKKHRIDVQDRTLAQLVRRCQELPGQELFCYIDNEGTVRDVTSDDVNGYLREVAGAEFSAKDFRTWAGTVLAATALRELGPIQSQRQAKRHMLRAIEAVAQMLGNTPTICRRCYIHPDIFDSYLAGQTIAASKQSARPRLGLRPEEVAVMTLLRQRLAHSRKPTVKATTGVRA